MAKGIVIKIWNIKDGSMGRGAGTQIHDSIDYITNSEKCDETLGDGGAQIGRELIYVTNDVKTLEGLYVGCRLISDIKNATDEMMQVKQFHGKMGGRVALHGIVSLDAQESDKKNAGKLMMLLNDLLEEVFPDNQAVYAVHTNTENLHIHFIVNTVGLNGKKIHMDKHFMSRVLEPALNRLADKYSFTPNMEWVKEKEKDKKAFGVRMVMLRQAVDEAIERSEDFDEFIKNLKAQGLKVNCGKHLSLKAEGMTKAVRSHRLGSMYTIDKIRDRILTKREELIRSEVSDHIMHKGIPEYLYVKTLPLKKYSDMTDEEKKACISSLKLGGNPWRERKRSNWQIQRMADEFQRTAEVHELIKVYAPQSRSAQDALDNIILRQKQIAEDKKAVKDNLKKYLPIIKLYKEIKKHAGKAYLYEFAEYYEYLPSYREYKALCERLEKGYGKTVLEVSAYLEDQENQLLYAAAQSKELSDEYKTIYRFKENELKQGIMEYVSLYDAIGLSKARNNAYRHGVYESSIKYVAADGADGGYLRVMITPDVIEGKRTERATVTIFDSAGNRVNEISSSDMPIKEFNQTISELKAHYGFYKCHIFDKKDEAKAYVEKQKEENTRKAKRKTAD